MMRAGVFLVFLRVAFECFAKGAGLDTQSIFTPDNVWIWHIAGVCYLFGGAGAVWEMSK